MQGDQSTPQFNWDVVAVEKEEMIQRWKHIQKEKKKQRTHWKTAMQACRKKTPGFKMQHINYLSKKEEETRIWKKYTPQDVGTNSLLEMLRKTFCRDICIWFCFSLHKKELQVSRAQCICFHLILVFIKWKAVRERDVKNEFWIPWLGFKKVIYLKICLKLMPREATGNTFALTVIAL